MVTLGGFHPGPFIKSGQLPGSPVLFGLFLFMQHVQDPGLCLDHFALLGFRLRCRCSCSRFFLSRFRSCNGSLFRSGSEGCIGVVNAVHPLPGMENLSTQALMKRIPPLDSYERLTAEDQGEQFALPTEVGHLTVNELILDQAPDLPVHHPVKLGNQDNIIPQLSMLRKEAEPLGPAILLPFSGIEQQLTLIDHQQNRTFLRLGSYFILAKLDQEIRGHFMIWAVDEIRPFVLG